MEIRNPKAEIRTGAAVFSAKHSVHMVFVMRVLSCFYQIYRSFAGPFGLRPSDFGFPAGPSPSAKRLKMGRRARLFRAWRVEITRWRHATISQHRSFFYTEKQK